MGASNLGRVQGKLGSFLEASSNVLSGFLISWLMWQFVVAPIWGYDTGVADATGITLLFTVSSLIRSYTLRRLFNWWQERKLHERYTVIKRSDI